jgi:restriction endonuclease S subunit
MQESDYLFYLVQSNYFVSLADATSYGVKMPRTSWEAISSYYIPIPKISEQHRIVEFLDDISEKIDETTQKIKSQIETLKEYRQTLISNVVTGKVKINEDQ